MELDNRTQLDAALLRGSLPGVGDEPAQETVALLVAKASGVIDARGNLRLELGLRTPVCHEPVLHPHGQLPADLALRKQGLEVLALGRVYHPELDGGGQSEVVVRLHDQQRSLRAFGERHWYRAHDGKLRISTPQPFSLLSLAWSNAFGGSSFDLEGNECPHPLNLEGKGYIACEQAVEDTPLPNLEHPEQLIQSWRDQPRPCSLSPAPRQLALAPEPLLAALAAARERAEPVRVPVELWHDAVPRFRFAAPPPGAPVELAGMSEQPLRGWLPTFQLWADARVGERQLRLPLALDTLLWLPEEQRVLFTFRASFRYRFAPRETRCVQLTMEG